MGMDILYDCMGLSILPVRIRVYCMHVYGYTMWLHRYGHSVCMGILHVVVWVYCNVCVFVCSMYGYGYTLWLYGYTAFMDMGIQHVWIWVYCIYGLGVPWDCIGIPHVRVRCSMWLYGYTACTVWLKLLYRPPQLRRRLRHRSWCHCCPPESPATRRNSPASMWHTSGFSSTTPLSLSSSRHYLCLRHVALSSSRHCLHHVSVFVFITSLCFHHVTVSLSSSRNCVFVFITQLCLCLHHVTVSVFSLVAFKTLQFTIFIFFFLS